MAVTRRQIGENVKRIWANVAAAAGRAKRDGGNVQLVAVTKAVGIEQIKTLIELGVTDLGENRVQQLVPRVGEVAEWLGRRRKAPAPAVRWHMVGHLQRNKVRQVLPVVEMIHSVDSLRLAEDIDTRGERAGLVANVLLEVNCSGEDQKYGVAVGAVTHLAEQICTLRNLRLLGLMTMAPLTRDPEKARPTFVRLREIFEDMISEKVGGKEFRQLSMGLSQDYQVAVEEGATIIRVGTAIFE